MEVAKRDKYDNQRRIGLILISILELIIIAGMSVLAYFLREMDYFPVRTVKFQCIDETISATLSDGKDSMSKFDYKADIPYLAIVIISFCLPPVVMFICELARWKATSNNKISISLCCAICRVSTTFRRIIRFIFVFAVGILLTLIFTDVTKLFVGRLRPIFLEECQLNMTACSSAPSDWLTDSACLQTSATRLKWARKSFPSFHSSLTAFSSIFLALYWQNVVGHGLRCGVFGPFVSFGLIIMCLMCGLSRYALNYSHWTDVAVGFALGAAIAVYIAVFTLKNFYENSDLSNLQLPELYQTYNSYSMGRDRVPWHWAPWHWTVQDYLDNKVDRRVEAPYYHRSAPEATHHVTDDMIRRHSTRDPRPTNDVVRPLTTYTTDQ